MTKKMEWIYREILYEALERREHTFTQRGLSRKCRISIGNVNKALAPLEKMNAIEKKSRGFRVLNPKKIMLYWASIRRLDRDMIFQTRTDKSVEQIEKQLPPCIFTAYSGYKFRFDSKPADYSEVVVYGDAGKIEDRFEKKTGKPNIIVLKSDPHLKEFKQMPLAQMFVDLWNLGTWYAEDFLMELENRIDKILKK